MVPSGKSASSSKVTCDFIAGQLLFYLDFSNYVIPDWLFLSTQAQIFISWLLVFRLTSVAVLAIVLYIDSAVISQSAEKGREEREEASMMT